MNTVKNNPTLFLVKDDSHKTPWNLKLYTINVKDLQNPKVLLTVEGEEKWISASEIIPLPDYIYDMPFVFDKFESLDDFYNAYLEWSNDNWEKWENDSKNAKLESYETLDTLERIYYIDCDSDGIMKIVKNNNSGFKYKFHNWHCAFSSVLTQYNLYLEYFKLK